MREPITFSIIGLCGSTGNSNADTMDELTGAEAIIQQLEHEGVDLAFGIPGVHTLEIYDALINSSIKNFTTRHEQGAGFMADGYARTTSRVGVLFLITGPGLTNAATPIAQAYSDSSPLLVISSENETREAGQSKGLLHELKDQKGMMENIVAYSERVNQVQDLPNAISKAFRYLESHRSRPIHIEVPMDILSRTKPVQLVSEESKSPPTPANERINKSVELLAKSEQPLLVVGGGATSATETVREFVDYTNIPTVTTAAGKGIIPETNDYCLGCSLRREPVTEFASNRDLVIAVGTELSPMDTKPVDLPEPMIHIDIDYTNFDKNYPATVGISGDAKISLQKILDRLRENEVEYSTNVEKLVQLKEEVKKGAESTPGLKQQSKILKVIRDVLNDHDILVNDMTKICYTASWKYPSTEPRTFLYPRGLGTLGFSPPVAFGAALGNEDRNVVSLVGDGGFMFTVQDLATAVKYNLPVAIILLNDEGYGEIKDRQNREYGGRTIGIDIANPDFVELARSFGAEAERIKPSNIENSLPRNLSDAFSREGPTLLEIPVDF